MKKKKKGRRRRGVSVDGKYTVTHTHTRRVCGMCNCEEQGCTDDDGR